MQVPILLDVIRTFSKDGGCFACGIWMTTLTGRLWPDCDRRAINLAAKKLTLVTVRDYASWWSTPLPRLLTLLLIDLDEILCCPTGRRSKDCIHGFFCGVIKHCHCHDVCLNGRSGNLQKKYPID